MSSSHRPVLRTLLAAATPLALGACTLVGGGAVPGSTPQPTGPYPGGGTAASRGGPGSGESPAAGAHAEGADAATRIATRVVDVALQSIGTPYEWGGTDANGFDCSGLIQFAYARLGIRLPRTSAAQIRAGSPVAPRPAVLRPGDVLGFSGDGSGKTDHVGLYVGSDEFIHSSSSGVRISSLRNPYWRGSLVAARRIVE